MLAVADAPKLPRQHLLRIGRVSLIIFLGFIRVSLLDGVIDLRVCKDLERLQRETDHHGGGIEADALSAPPLITPLTAPPTRPLAIDDQREKDKVQSNARQHRPCDEFEIR